MAGSFALLGGGGVRLVSGEKSCGKRALHGVRDEGVAVAGSADVPGAAGLCGMTGACVKE